MSIPNERSLLTQGLSQCRFKVHAIKKTTVKSVQAWYTTRVTRPFGNSLAFSERFTVAVAALIIGLRNAVCPSAIARLVVAVIVLAVNRQTFSVSMRQRPVSKRWITVSPFLTDAYTTRSVKVKGWTDFTVTSGNHRPPNAIQGGRMRYAGIPVFCVNPGCSFIFQTATRARHTTPKRTANNQLFSPAIAATGIKQRFAAMHGTARNCPSSKPLTNRMIDTPSHVALLKENPVNPGPRWCLSIAGINGKGYGRDSNSLSGGSHIFGSVSLAYSKAARPGVAVHLRRIHGNSRTPTRTAMLRPFYYTTLRQQVERL